MASDDVRTAVSDLKARPVQAAVVSLNAFGWRATAVLVPIALLLVLASFGGVASIASPELVLLAALAPLAIALVLTVPAVFVPNLLTLFSGTEEQQNRFASTSFAYPYYGWRYAFRSRTRPWGAMTAEERRAANPKRAGALEDG